VKTYVVKPKELVRDWYVVDAEGKNLGRLASEIAQILKGKHRPFYTPNVDCGDHVIVVNAGKIEVTGRKLDKKMYHRHSMYPGGLHSISLNKQLVEHPTRALQAAVKGMLPKNRLGRAMMKKLRIYATADHPHQAQSPKPLEF
jgi:large subunit ribosomal protein L13